MLLALTLHSQADIAFLHVLFAGLCVYIAVMLLIGHILSIRSK